METADGKKLVREMSGGQISDREVFDGPIERASAFSTSYTVKICIFDMGNLRG